MTSKVSGWRWLVVSGAVTFLVALPPLVAMIPAAESGIGAAALLRLIVTSGDVAYQGVSESNAGFRFPDFERAQRLVELFGEKTTVRVWHVDRDRWRVDELGQIDEFDSYSDPGGLWVWNSDRRAATRIEGSSPVRLARAADLIPSELGLRLASAAEAGEVSRLPSRRVAGVHAAGLRIEPQSTRTTVDRVDMWADPATGLVVAVQVKPVGSGVILSSNFLEIDISRPADDVLAFTPPRDAEVGFTRVPDFAHAVDRFSPFVLPDRIGTLPRRTSVASAAATYGEGFDLVAALVLGSRYVPFRADELATIPEVEGEFGRGRLLRTPLVNALYVERGPIAYMIGGTVDADALMEAGARLIGEIEAERGLILP